MARNSAAVVSKPIDASQELRIGFVPLLDAAPLIAALELGYFGDERLPVTLHRQIGWGNVRDKLVYGSLHASHALFGMAPASVLGEERFANYPEPLVSLMALGTGGDAITLSRILTDAGVTSPAAMLRWARRQSRNESTRLAHVFGCSVHHYILRQWLDEGGVNPDRDLQLCVLPPSQMPRHVAGGYLDGYCAGEPWNTLAVEQGVAKIVALTTDIVPAHPDKVLAVRRRWLEDHLDTATAMVRAVIRACGFCNDPGNFDYLAELLARPHYFAIPAESLRKSLEFAFVETHMRNCDPQATTFPSATHAGWLVAQMARWGHVPHGTNIESVARDSIDSRAYRQAAAGLGIITPTQDCPPMRLRQGCFELQRAMSAVGSDPIIRTIAPDEGPRKDSASGKSPEAISKKLAARQSMF